MSRFCLDIGCGLNPKKPLDEWTHLDFNSAPHIEIVCDWKKIDLPNESVDEIWLGDVIEHIPLWEEVEVLGEWNRILKNGGVIGGSTPNIMKTFHDYINGVLPIREILVPRLYGWTDRPTEQHYITHTEETLTKLFADHGFDVRDYSASPGGKERWWFIFSGRKI